MFGYLFFDYVDEFFIWGEKCLLDVDWVIDDFGDGGVLVVVFVVVEEFVVIDYEVVGIVLGYVGGDFYGFVGVFEIIVGDVDFV